MKGLLWVNVCVCFFFFFFFFFFFWGGGGMVLAADFFFGTVETMASGQIRVNKLRKYYIPVCVL